MSCALPHKKWLAVTALPAGKTLYFFTVLLTGSSSIFLHQGAFCHCLFLLDLFTLYPPALSPLSDLDKVPVSSFLAHQLLMGALLSNAAILHH